MRSRDWILLSLQLQQDGMVSKIGRASRRDEKQDKAAKPLDQGIVAGVLTSNSIDQQVNK